MNRGFLGLVILFLYANSLAREPELSAREVFALASRSIVIVRTFDETGQALALGSGVTVAPEVVVTNCHVLDNASFTKVDESRQHGLAATLVRSNTARDLCSLSVPGLIASPANFGSTQRISVGDRVYAIGAPQGLELTLSDGLVSSLRKLSDGDILQITAPISHGSSGGGLFNKDASLVGITTLYLDDSQQLNFAVPVEWVEEILRSNQGTNGRLGGSTNDATNHAQAATDAATGVPRRRIGNTPDPIFVIQKITLWTQPSASNDVTEPREIFLPNESIHASVVTKGNEAHTITARWTYGSDDQLVLAQTKTVPSGFYKTDFSIDKPDGWPLGGYTFSIFANGDRMQSAHFCVQDGISLCQKVNGLVYSYVAGGLRHYSSTPAPSGATAIRTIKYSYFTLIQP